MLIVGFDPAAVPNVDTEQVTTALRLGQDKFEGTNLVPHQCLVSLDETAYAQVADALRERPYDCVVIGGGIRKPEAFLEFFEAVVNMVRRHAPQAVLAFNSDPTDSYDAAARALSAATG